MKNNNRGSSDAGVLIFAIAVLVVCIVSWGIRTVDRWRVATYYTTGSITASGEPYDPTAMTCADPAASFGTWLRVETRDVTPIRVIYVRVNDRPPKNEIKLREGDDRLDLTPAAFKQLAPLAVGKINVSRKEVK